MATTNPMEHGDGPLLLFSFYAKLEEKNDGGGKIPRIARLYRSL